MFIENIENQYAEVINNVNGIQVINQYDALGPYIDPEELVYIIDIFYKNTSDSIQGSPPKPKKRTDLPTKNELNGMSDDYCESFVENRITDFSAIEDFIANPANIEYKQKYNLVCKELNTKLILCKKKHQNDFDMAFDELATKYAQTIKGPNSSRFKELVRIFVAFMYFSCDIGKKLEDEKHVST